MRGYNIFLIYFSKQTITYIIKQTRGEQIDNVFNFKARMHAAYVTPVFLNNLAFEFTMSGSNFESIVIDFDLPQYQCITQPGVSTFLNYYAPFFL